MIMISFKSRRDKEHLLERAKKMEEYASMIVECIEDSSYYDDDYYEKSYRSDDEMMDMNDKMMGRYGYNRRRMK